MILLLFLFLAGPIQAAEMRPIQKAEFYFEMGKYDETLKIITPMVKSGDAEAMVLQGRMHESGRGAKKDTDEAIRLYRRASAKLHPSGRFQLARLYREGTLLEKDPGKALKMATVAAEAGYPPAMGMLGQIYSQGDGTERDYTQAVTWYERGASLGDKDSEYALGLMYLSGIGLPKQISNAAGLLKRAAERGHPQAMHLYGLLLSGTGEGVKVEPVEAYSWLALASARGIKEADKKMPDLEARLSQPQLAEARKRTASMAKDLAAGRKAGEGEPIIKPRTPVDDMREAFDTGRYPRAREIGKALIEKNDPEALFIFGLMHERGLGGKKDQQKGLELMTQAGNIGWPAAQYNLGVTYEHGNTATKVKPLDAYVWYTLASAQGDEDARDKSKLMQDVLSPEELTEAKKRIGAWVTAYRKAHPAPAPKK